MHRMYSNLRRYNLGDCSAAVIHFLIASRYADTNCARTIPWRRDPAGRGKREWLYCVFNKLAHTIHSLHCSAPKENYLSRPTGPCSR